LDNFGVYAQKPIFELFSEDLLETQLTNQNIFNSASTQFLSSIFRTKVADSAGSERFPKSGFRVIERDDAQEPGIGRQGF
jgi:hypothetical protein